MKLIPLGKTNLLVSEVGLGTVEMGMAYGIPTSQLDIRPDASETMQTLNEALDLGINFIDTARIYGNSEAIIGQALMQRRHEYFIATKLMPLDLDQLRTPGLRERVLQSVQDSLRALRTDHIDLLMIYSATEELIQEMDGLLEILNELKCKGYCRYVGASVYERAGEEALKKGGLDCLQIAYSALDRSADRKALPEAQKKGVGIVVRSVFLKGVLTFRYRDLPDDLAELRTAAERLERLAVSAGMTLPELAFRYVLGRGFVALFGTARASELYATLEYASRGPLDETLLQEIRKIDISDQRLLNPNNWSIP